MTKASPKRGPAVSLYLREIRASSPNAGREEHSVAPGTQPTGACGKAGLDLVTSNLPFVVTIACGYKNLGLPFEDLLNEGTLGLIEAAGRFDPARGTRFISYAAWWIRKAILKAISHNAGIVHIPEYQAKRVREVRDTRRILARELGREPGREEISRKLRLTVARVDRILQMRVWKLSLDDKVREDRDMTVVDRLADERSVSPEEEMIRSQNRVLLRQALRSLSRRQLSVIVHRFGLEGGRARTLKEIGERLGVSRERVRQIENEARKRLRKVMLRRAAADGRPQRLRPHDHLPEGPHLHDESSAAAAGPLPG